MAYSTQGSTAVSVTNFGAKGDGVSLDTNSIQSAINSLYAKGGGSLYFPKARYLTSGYLHITGSNISLIGEKGAVITTSAGGDFRKLNISGCSGVSVNGLTFDGGRTGTTEQYVGTVNLYSAPYFSLTNSAIEKTEGLGVSIRGDSRNINLSNNVFSDYHIGVYGDSNDISGIAPTNVSIVENVFNKSWGVQPEQNYFGGIKLQNVGFENNGRVPARSYGHMILNNKFSGTNQMGIELWGYISDSAVIGNYIENTHFGISIAASSNNIAIASNNIKGCTYVGIEVADSQGVTVSNNVINGATGNNYSNPVSVTQEGIIINGINRSPSRATVVGNTILDCNRGVHIYNTSEVTVLGNQIILTGQGTNQNFYTTNSSFVNFSNNTLVNRTGSHFCFLLTDSARGSTGITIANNDFVGSVQQWGVLFYSSAGSQQSAVVENNRTYAVDYCQYGMFSPGPLVSAVIRNNYGQTGSLGYYISDQTIPAGSSPYTQSSIQNGYQFYGTSTISIPSSGIPYSSGAWINIASGNLGGNVKEQRFIVKYAGTGPPYTYDNKQENIEFFTSITPYSLNAFSITVMPQGDYVSNIVQRIQVDNPGGAEDGAVWINIRSGSLATSGYQMTVYGSDSLLITSPIIQFNRPNFTVNSVGIDLDSVNRTALKTTYGLGIGGAGGGVIYSPSSGRINAEAPNGWSFTSGNVGIGTTNPGSTLHINGSLCLSGITTSTTANVGAATLPANPVGFITINITGGDFKIPYYNV